MNKIARYRRPNLTSARRLEKLLKGKGTLTPSPLSKLGHEQIEDETESQGGKGKKS